MWNVLGTHSSVEEKEITPGVMWRASFKFLLRFCLLRSVNEQVTGNICFPDVDI